MLECQYREFIDQCRDETSERQDKFKELYDLDWYENWNYDQGGAIFTLSKDEKRLNFRYVEVGTFSTKTNTWKWSWGNEHTLPQVKKGMEQVRAFGEKEEVVELTTGLIYADEDKGWEFTSLACKLLDGIGVYRAQSDHLFVFMVLIKLVEPETAKEMMDKYLECGEHGEKRRRAFVCQHLNKEKKAGFNEAFGSYPEQELELEDNFQAWCDQCEKVRAKEGEWNKRSEPFANISLVCEDCYFEMKKLNTEGKKG